VGEESRQTDREGKRRLERLPVCLHQLRFIFYYVMVWALQYCKDTQSAVSYQ